MATIVFVAAASAYGAAAGSIPMALAAAAGMYVDQNVLMPQIFGKTPEGPRLGDVQVSTSEEGAGVPRPYGRVCVVPCGFIWITPIKEVKKTESAGKGGGGGDFITYTYYIDGALGLCNRQIKRVLKLWADGKIFYDIAPDIDYSDDTFSVSKPTTQTWNPFGGPITKTWMDVTSTSSGPDLSKIKSGKNVELAGFANAANNGSFKCQWSKKNASGTTTMRLDNAAAVVEGAGATVSVHQTLPTHNPKQVKSLTFYNGTADQQPDPLIKAVEGASTPGFRGKAYVVIEQLLLTDYGNRPPTFEALVEVDDAATVGNAIRDICTAAKLAQVDVEGLDDTFLGLTEPGPGPLIQSLHPILIAYDIIAYQRGATVYFRKRSDLEQLTIPEEHLGVMEDGGELADRPFRELDRSPWLIPDRVQVTHIDPDKDYGAGAQWHQANTPESAEVSQVNLPMVLDSDDAATIAKRLQVMARINSRTVRFRLPPSYAGRVAEGMVLFLQHDGNKTLPVITTSVDRAALSDMLECEGVREDIDAPLVKARSYRPKPVPPFNPHYYPGAVVLIAMDLAPLQESHADSIGMYFAAAHGNQELQFTGASIFESADGGITWRGPIGTVPFAATIGHVTVPPSTNVLPDTWDTASAMEVKLLRGEELGALSSVTEDECLAGKNRAYVGGELIGFRDAELVSSDSGGDTYRLTNLLRGLRGSAGAIAGQLEGAEFVLLDANRVVFVELAGSAIGQERQYIAVPPGGAVLDAIPVVRSPMGLSARPLPPNVMRLTRDTSNNATIVIMAVHRGLGRSIAVDWAASHEPVEAWVVEIMDGADVVRTIRAFVQDPTSMEIAFTYSAANQTADGFTPGDPITFRAFQRSHLLREGLRSEPRTL